MSNSKEELSKKIASVRDKIVECSSDKEQPDKLLSDLLSLKAQYDVEPTEFIVSTKDVVKEYKFGAYKFVRTLKGIMFHTYGGYTVFVDARMRSLYDRLSYVLDLKDNFENLSDEDKKLYDLMFSATYYMLAIPFLLSPFDTKFYEIAGKCIEALNESFKDSLEKAKEQVENNNVESENPADFDFSEFDGIIGNTPLMGEKNDRSIG